MLPLDETQIGVIRQGLEAVVRSGTAASPFAGFPLEQFPIARQDGNRPTGRYGG